MALDVNDDADAVRSVKRKFGNIERDWGPENPSVGFSEGELKRKKTNHIKDADSDYLQYLRGGYMSIRDNAQDELFVLDVGDDPLPEFSTEDVGGDPQYELFLSSLKKHGSSYVLQVDDKIGLIKPLKYEECESDDAGQEDLDSLSKTQWGESEIDDDYAFFHDHLRVEGSNLIYQLDHGLRMVYEDLTNFQRDNGTYSRKRKSKLSIHKQKSSDSIKRMVYNGRDLPKFQTDNGTSSRKRKSKLSIRKAKSSKSSEEDSSSHLGSQKFIPHDGWDLPKFQTDNGTCSRKRKSKLSIHNAKSSDSSEEDSSSHSGGPRRKNHVVYDCQDLPNVQTDNGTSPRKQKSKVSIHNENSSDSSEDDRSSHSGSPRRKKHVVHDCQDLPNVQTDNGTSPRKQKSKVSIRNENSSDTSEEDSSSHSGSPSIKKCNKFRVRIMRILHKPYDKEEHKKLMEEIILQKNQNRHIDLRSGEVRFCVSDKKGKSYLDHHGDLKRKVQAATKDDCKQLNLLRGFFFWIQNLTQDGSFIPWNDKECLALRPQAC